MSIINAKTVIGLYVGKKYTWAQALDTETNKALKEERLPNTPKDLIGFLHGLPRPTRLVFEATENWSFFYGCFSSHVDEILMAHPLKTKAIASARIKTDKIDMRTLAHLGRADLIPCAYCPPPEIRDLRELLRHRAFLTALGTKVKNRIHAYLWKLGVETPFSDLFGTKGQTWLKGLSVPERFRILIDQDLRILEVLKNEIQTTTRTLNQQAKQDPLVPLLLPIPGIGIYSAMLILAEIGDVKRFESPKKLVSYAGLCPSTYQSGTRAYHGRITKQGSRWLRWILIEAAQHYAKTPGTLGTFYRRMMKKKGSQMAKVALARRILTGIYYCLTKGVPYQDQPDHPVSCSRTLEVGPGAKSAQIYD